MKSYEIVGRLLQSRIRKEKLTVGDALPSETALASLFGVHRSTLREALRMLERDGFVYREPGRRKLRVGQPRVQDLSYRLVSAMVAQEVTFEELYEAMHVLEPAMARNAALRATPETIAALKDNLARTRSAIDDRESLTKLDVEFHSLIAQAARSRALDAARHPLSRLFYPAFYPVMRRLNAAERLLVAHSHIVAAIAGGDAMTSGEWMMRHIEDFQRGYMLANLDMTEAVGIDEMILSPGFRKSGESPAIP